MAKLKHDKIEIPTEPGTDPFEHCKLNRKPYSEVLTDIVTNYADGFVMAINNKWGTGKTTFVAMWQQHLKNKGFQTLYFNAWENDFEDDVMVALLSELKELKGNGGGQAFEEVMKRAAPLTKKLLPSMAKALAKKYVGEDFVKELIEGMAEVSAEGLEAEMKSYTQRKDGIQSFRKSLEKYVQDVDNEKPVVFILDELDRCRPNYAVEVLEQIKHLFSVPGIIFVLSIDKVQLGHAVRGVYGSEKLDADEYLRRFIDLEYSVPSPTTGEFADFLFEKYDLHTFFRSEARKKMSPFQNDETLLKDIATILSVRKNLTLRQLEKLYGYTSVVLNSFRSNHYVLPHVLFFLIYLKLHESQKFLGLTKKNFSILELRDLVEDPFPDNLPQANTTVVLLTTAFIIGMYNNSLGPEKESLLRKVDGTEKDFLESKFFNSKTALTHFIGYFNDDMALDSIGLEFLLNKIELTEKFATGQ